jgi:hypothetical protein
MEPRTHLIPTLIALLVVALSPCGCSGGSSPGDAALIEAQPESTAGDIDAPDLAADGDFLNPNDPDFDPRLVLGAPGFAPVRGWAIKPGHLHAHNVFSHDACDGQPRVDGETGPRNEECYREFRAALCDTGQDFMFMTDHTSGLFCEFEFPEVLYYEPADGDELLMRDGAPVANWIKCPDGRRVLLQAGFDGELMALGLERHLRVTPEERHEIYGSITPGLISELHANGALVAAAYASDWDALEILQYPWDGYELYNPATNLRGNMGAVLQLLGNMRKDPASSPDAEVAYLFAFQEGAENLSYWANIILKRPVFNYIGTNIHRNAVPGKMPDGERLDSYRRFMHIFGNYLLIPAERAANYDDLVLKQAIAAGRLYNSFSFLGIPIGFDFHAEVDGQVHEMGSQLPLEPTVRLVAETPHVYGRMPKASAPEVVSLILRAIPDGWQEVARGSGQVTYDVSEPGVYRLDVHIVPNHLVPWLGKDPSKGLVEHTWVYSNSIYVGMDYSASTAR